jgi:cytoskeletal protein RodZ
MTVMTDELGPRLRDARIARGLTLADIARATRIPQSALTHLEEGRFDQLPAPVFVRGFIRSFARVVGCDAGPLVRSYEARVASGVVSAAPESPGTAGLPRTSEKRDSAIERKLDPSRKLVPLQPVSERREGSFRGGFALIAVAAIGLLVAAWLLVGQRKPIPDSSARIPSVPLMHERINGLPNLDVTPDGRGPGVR